MNMKYNTTKQFIAATLLLSGTAMAQDTLAPKQLKEVTITANRYEQNPLDVPRSVTVLTGDSIRNSGVNTLPELLAQQEGLFVMGTNQNPGQLQTLYTRGAGPNQTLILIDGVRISDPSSPDNGLDLNELSLAAIDRIEIVRGSHSTLYGSSAIGGVINIVTNKANAEPGVRVNAQVMQGTIGAGTLQVGGQVGVNYTHKSGFYVGLTGLGGFTNGFDATLDTVSNPQTFLEKNRDKDGFMRTDAMGKLGFKNEKLDVYASGRMIHYRTDIDKGAYNDDANYVADFQRQLFTYGAAYRFNDQFSISYIGGSTVMNREVEDDSSQIADDGTTDQTYFKAKYSGGNTTNELLANYKRKGLSVVAGGSLFSEAMSAETYYYSNGFFGVYESRTNLDSLDIKVNTLSAFIHADLGGELINDKLSRFRLGLGFRNVTHDLFGNTFTWEIAPSVKVSESSLVYGAVSTGFNAPSLYQLYSPEKDFTSNITRGNKKLNPEKSLSYELGIKQQLTEGLSIGISYFHTTLENAIDYVYLWDGTRPIDSLSYLDYRGDTYLNVGRSINQGVEFSATLKLSAKVTFMGNVSLVSGRLVYHSDGFDTTHTHGNQAQLYSNGVFITKEIETAGLVRRPNTGNFTLIYTPISKLRFTLQARYVGTRSDVYYSSQLGPFGALATRPVGDFTLIGAGARYQIGKYLAAQVRVDNIFDIKYSEIYGYSTRGRSIFVNLNFSL